MRSHSEHMLPRHGAAQCEISYHNNQTMGYKDFFYIDKQSNSGQYNQKCSDCGINFTGVSKDDVYGKLYLHCCETGHAFRIGDIDHSEKKNSAQKKSLPTQKGNNISLTEQRNVDYSNYMSNEAEQKIGNGNTPNGSNLWKTPNKGNTSGECFRKKVDTPVWERVPGHKETCKGSGDMLLAVANETMYNCSRDKEIHCVCGKTFLSDSTQTSVDRLMNHIVKEKTCVLSTRSIKGPQCLCGTICTSGPKFTGMEVLIQHIKRTGHMISPGDKAYCSCNAVFSGTPGAAWAKLIQHMKDCNHKFIGAPKKPNKPKTTKNKVIDDDSDGLYIDGIKIIQDTDQLDEESSEYISKLTKNQISDSGEYVSTPTKNQICDTGDVNRVKKARKKHKNTVIHENNYHRDTPARFQPFHPLASPLGDPHGVSLLCYNCLTSFHRPCKELAEAELNDHILNDGCKELAKYGPATLGFVQFTKLGWDN